MSRVGEPLGPWWLERQLDPESPDFQVGARRENVTHRDWVQLGTVSTIERGVVDPRGLVTPGTGRWSLDWWVGADDRWHVPAREVAVRQHRVDDAPVIETAMRVPGGDAIHRAYAVQGPTGPQLVVEVENRTAIPFALAFAVVPYGPTGDGSVHSITVDDTTVHVDGVAAVLLPKAPARVAGGCRGDALTTVVDGLAAPPDRPHAVRCETEQAELAFVFPVPHTSGVRLLLPLAPERGAAAPVRVASAEDVTKGWAAQVERGPRLDLPDDRFRHAFEAARRDLLLLHAGEDVIAWPGVVLPWTTRARVVEAFDLLGFHVEAEQILRGVADEQRLDGAISSSDRTLASNGAALRALGLHWQHTRDDALIDDLVGPIAKAGHWIEKRRTARRRPLLATARYADALWGVSGMRAVVPALTAIGQPEVSEDLGLFAAALLVDVERAMAADRVRLDRPVPPAAPGAALGPDATANLVAALLDVRAGDHDHLVGLAELTRERWVVDGLVVDDEGWGLDPVRTLDLALAELRAGDDRAAGRIIGLLDHASAVDTWPQVIHPRSGGGARGHGQDPTTTAAFCTFVRSMLVREEGATDVALCRVVPAGWLGQGWEVRDLPTRRGRLGFAVRWHGERPALLWELVPWDDGTEPENVRITVPGLDRAWSSTERHGEALLAPVTLPDRLHPDEGGAEASSSFA